MMISDTEIDRRLALAIGYRPEDVMVVRATGQIVVDYYGIWSLFSHLRWDVVGPIAEKFDLFPVRLTDGKWSRVVCGPAPAFLLTDIIESTPQRCIALAALCALERK